MSHKKIDPVIQDIIDLTGQDPALCYQCGKCSAGCPVRDFTETPPNRVVRYVQLGFYDKAFESPSIWLCAGCLTCSSRCPQEFELARFMDALREIAVKKGKKISEKKVEKFHKAFLKQIENNGRSFELGLLIDYKLKTMDLFQDMDVAPATLLRGKLGFFPHQIKGKDKIKRMFNKAQGEDK
ncbi:MAG: 4Fe-4S dicluster domain-containing protein [Ignavibacteriaceae bacterium]